MAGQQIGRPGGSGPVRYLAQNHCTWTPAVVITLDSETRTVRVGDLEVERLRCWAAKCTRRRSRRRAGEVSMYAGVTPTQAAVAVDAWASEDKSTWLYAHNVGFDLVTTGLPVELAALGWELSSRHAVSGSAPWLVLHKGRQGVTEARVRNGQRVRERRVKWQHTLTIADSFSLMPVALEVLAQWSAYTKPPLPDQDADLEAWQDRCAADVDILADVLLQLMDWWDSEDLGKWAVSGAACWWNAYRHRMDAKAVVIDPEPAAVELEHAACYGGRRDVFRTGNLPQGRYAEMDYKSGYPTIAAAELLPCKRMGPLTPQITRSILRGLARYGILAEVLLDTDTPRWPLRVRGRVFYPVGKFRTVLAGPDILEAQAEGVLAEVGRGWFYAMSGHMRSWASWVLDLQAADDATVPGPARVSAKGGSRSVCGKWAQRGYWTEECPGPPGAGWSYDDYWIAGSDVTASLCGLAGKHYLSLADQEGSHEFPAILAYIEAHTRVRLGRVLAATPAAAAIQCDTDGLMVSITTLEDELAAQFPHLAGKHHRGGLVGMWLESMSALSAPLTLREKRLFKRAVVYGPQHVVLDGRPRFSGVPQSAYQVEDHRWRAQLWPGLAWQITSGQQDGYARPVQDYLVTGPYAAGWVLADGSVRPVEAALGADGSSHLVPWPQTRWAAAGEQLGPVQAGWSGGLWDDTTT